MNTYVEQIRKELFELQDLKYRSFSSKLIPNVDPDRVIGIRTPVLRAYAKKLHGSKAESEFLSCLPHTYFDEDNLHAFLLELNTDFDSLIAKLDVFLPYVDNWSTCDLFNPKCFKKHRSELYEKIKIWIKSDKVYTARFAVNMLMGHFLDDSFTPEVLELAASVRLDDYYARMVVAWLFATALAKQYDCAIKYIEEYRLDKWTHNKTISKARESYRITVDVKEYLNTLKVK